MKIEIVEQIVGWSLVAGCALFGITLLIAWVCYKLHERRERNAKIDAMLKEWYKSNKGG